MITSCVRDSERSHVDHLLRNHLDPVMSQRQWPAPENGSVLLNQARDTNQVEFGEQFLDDDYTSVQENNNDFNESPCHGSDSEGEGSAAESDKQIDPESESEEEEDDEEEEEEEGSDRDFSSDDPSLHSRSAPSSGEASYHELYLPRDISPSIQSLRHEGEDESSESSDEEEVPQYSRSTYVMGDSRSGRPRMWDGCPASVSLSSGSSCSSSACPSQAAERIKLGDKCKAGVSFSNRVTVYPIFATAAYPPSVLRNTYTPREELRANKRRNRRELARDDLARREAAEDEDTTPDDCGEPVPPANVSARTPPAPPRQTREVGRETSVPPVHRVVRNPPRHLSATGGYGFGRARHEAAEKEDAAPVDRGEPVPPAHGSARTPPVPLRWTREDVRGTSASPVHRVSRTPPKHLSAAGGYSFGNRNAAGTIRRTKRMRIYYP